MYRKGLAIRALAASAATCAILCAVLCAAVVRAQSSPGANPGGGGQGASAGQNPATPRPAAPRPITPGTGLGGQPTGARPAGAGATGLGGAQNANHPAVPAATPQDTTPADEPAPQIAISTPAPAPAPWPVQDRIAWGANIALALFAAVGIYIGLSLLKKIDRQTQYAETAAQSAAYSAQAALLHAQAITRAERPWILVTVEPSSKSENRFMIVATNRGRGPARILSAVDKITTEIDQSSLPAEPDYEDSENNESLESVVLLPGESTGIKTFGRDEVREFCGSDEKYRRVEKWEEVILLFGKIVYEDLVHLESADATETTWCCWYIHGRQNSGMVMAGPPQYNHHT